MELKPDAHGPRPVPSYHGSDTQTSQLHHLVWAPPEPPTGWLRFREWPESPSRGPSVDPSQNILASLLPPLSGALELVVGTGLALLVEPGRPLCPPQVTPLPGLFLREHVGDCPTHWPRTWRTPSYRTRPHGGPVAWLWPPGTQHPIKAPRWHWGDSGDQSRSSQDQGPPLDLLGQGSWLEGGPSR